MPKCLDDCHTYELDTVLNEGKGWKPGEYLTPFRAVMHFYEMRPDGTKIDGVTNEEVIGVLIHRLNFLNEKWMEGKFRCRENSLAITKLEEALMWLERRTANREKRGVEGKMEP